MTISPPCFTVWAASKIAQHSAPMLEGGPGTAPPRLPLMFPQMPHPARVRALSLLSLTLLLVPDLITSQLLLRC